MLNFDGDVDADANVKCEHTLKVRSHGTFAFLFDLCRPILENGNVKCEQSLFDIDPI